MHEERAVGLEHEKTNGFRQSGGQTACVQNLAAGHDETHKGLTVLSVSDGPAK
jgi:hypothetical protein